MQQHTIYFWTHLVVLNRKVAQHFLCANFVMKLCHQCLAFSGFMVLSRQLGTRKKTRLNHDTSDLQVGALERGSSSQFGIPSWMTIQNVFSLSELVSSYLELNEV